MKVTIVEAADLTPMRANGPADPCVKLTIGDSKIETPAVPKTLTPVVRCSQTTSFRTSLFLSALIYDWIDLIHHLCRSTHLTIRQWNVVTFFSVPDVESEKMTINVLDKVTGKSMGSATVRLTHFFPKCVLSACVSVCVRLCMYVCMCVHVYV